jgi:hypothetical protein
MKAGENDGSAVSLKTVAALSFAAKSNGSPTSRKCSQAQLLMRSPTGELAEHIRVLETSAASVGEMPIKTAAEMLASSLCEDDRVTICSLSRGQLSLVAQFNARPIVPRLYG